MDTPPIPPTPDGDERTGRAEILRAVAVAFIVAALVFLSVVGFIGLIEGNRTLGAVQSQTNQIKTLNENAAHFFARIGPTVNAFAQNSYLTCLAVHAQGCVKPG